MSPSYRWFLDTHVWEPTTQKNYLLSSLHPHFRIKPELFPHTLGHLWDHHLGLFLRWVFFSVSLTSLSLSLYLSLLLLFSSYSVGTLFYYKWRAGSIFFLIIIAVRLPPPQYSDIGPASSLGCVSCFCFSVLLLFACFAFGQFCRRLSCLPALKPPASASQVLGSQACSTSDLRM